MFQALFPGPDFYIRVSEDPYGELIDFAYVDGADNRLKLPVGKSAFHVYTSAFRRGMLQEVRVVSVKDYLVPNPVHRCRGHEVPDVDLIYYRPTEEMCQTTK